MNKLVAVVGMSGSGKSIATDYLEGEGWTKLYFGGITYKLMAEAGIERTSDGKSEKEGNNDFDYKLREEPRRTNTGIIKFPIAAKYGKINHPIGIDYRENHPCIYEK